ncbi:MAG: helix-turn-helix transcriptional regulator [Paludibacteraceae bacterium]|nr:helix-turn-helix transcriptional regulator [Paludibacteraceae bacterium]
MLYTKSHKMCQLMAQEHDAIMIISRFGLPMGVGEQTIEEVCAAHGVHSPTFLAVVNHKLQQADVDIEKVDVETLRTYLKNAHAYFVDFQLPRLRRALIEAVYPSETASRIPILILQSFDQFVQEIRTHVENEDRGKWASHKQGDEPPVTSKLSELKDLIIKYYPSDTTDVKQTYALIAVMNDLYDTEQDFITHCAIEEEILMPALAMERDGQGNADGVLSEREREVLVQVAKGLSNKEIADALCLSTHTVITHRKNIAAKLNIHSTAGLTIYAIANGLVEI